jgi:DNA-binding NarL/FixJ family response regulator
MPLLEEHEPDVFILDLGLPRLNGLNVLRKIQDRGVSVQIMILSMQEEDAYVSEAFDLGGRATC